MEQASELWNNREDCIKMFTVTNVYLKDGRKISLKRSKQTIGSAWMELSPQATIKAI